MVRLNVVNKVNSTLARENKVGVFLNCGRELSVASTKAYISQVVVLMLVTLWFAQHKNYNGTRQLRAQVTKELNELPDNFQTTLDTCEPFSMKMSKLICGKKHVFFVA